MKNVGLWMRVCWCDSIPSLDWGWKKIEKHTNYIFRKTKHLVYCELLKKNAQGEDSKWKEKNG